MEEKTPRSRLFIGLGVWHWRLFGKNKHTYKYLQNHMFSLSCAGSQPLPWSSTGSLGAHRHFWERIPEERFPQDCRTSSTSSSSECEQCSEASHGHGQRVGPRRIGICRSCGRGRDIVDEFHDNVCLWWESTHVGCNSGERFFVDSEVHIEGLPGGCDLEERGWQHGPLHGWWNGGGAGTPPPWNFMLYVAEPQLPIHKTLLNIILNLQRFPNWSVLRAAAVAFFELRKTNSGNRYSVLSVQSWTEMYVIKKPTNSPHAIENVCLRYPPMMDHHDRNHPLFVCANTRTKVAGYLGNWDHVNLNDTTDRSGRNVPWDSLVLYSSLGASNCCGDLRVSDCVVVSTQHLSNVCFEKKPNTVCNKISETCLALDPTPCWQRLSYEMFYFVSCGGICVTFEMKSLLAHLPKLPVSGLEECLAKEEPWKTPTRNLTPNRKENTQELTHKDALCLKNWESFRSQEMID